jgi:hypothetical protein
MSGAFLEYRYRKALVAFGNSMLNRRKFHRDAVMLLILDVRYRQ